MAGPKDDNTVELTNDTVVVAPHSGRHTHTVILLHGRGSEAAEFQSEFFESQDSAGHFLDKDLLPTVKWVFPKAGVEDVGSSGIQLSQWFDMTVTERPHENEEQQLAGLVASVEKIATIVHREAKEVGYDNIILGGISQGCATAVHALYELPRLAGFVGFASWMPMPERFIQAMKGSPPKMPVMVQHCRDDETIDLKYGQELRDTLERAGMRVQWREYEEGGHWFNEPEGIDDLSRFLAAHLKDV
ncbi:alpha/beta-hydrolase [Teratosphaeria destructans]|uniref:Alpha/beta-hydrolase n=1 Tax=Teratosphaeria destructans TaxID=418781 RepID=A0A9W7SLZ9_9PEZI|nr:alpha/beta-hydrolase [Teratosphaeria destructans]